MTKQDIINYVTETPQNTNPAILNTMLNQLDSGGGGSSESSDLSYATVNVTYTLPESVDSLEGATFTGYIRAVRYVTEFDYYNQAVSFIYGEESLPSSDLGTLQQFNVPLYKDYKTTLSYLTWYVPDVGNLYVDTMNSSVISGNAEIIYNEILITGECTLNIALMYD